MKRLGLRMKDPQKRCPERFLRLQWNVVEEVLCRTMGLTFSNAESNNSAFEWKDFGLVFVPVPKEHCVKLLSTQTFGCWSRNNMEIVDKNFCQVGRSCVLGVQA